MSQKKRERINAVIEYALRGGATAKDISIIRARLLSLMPEPSTVTALTTDVTYRSTQNHAQVDTDFMTRRHQLTPEMLANCN